MCGRFNPIPFLSAIVRLYRLTAPAGLGRSDAPAYHVAPTDPVPFVTAGENGADRLREGGGGWCRGGRRECRRRRCSTSRSESANTSGAFKNALRLQAPSARLRLDALLDPGRRRSSSRPPTMPDSIQRRRWTQPKGFSWRTSSASCNSIASAARSTASRTGAASQRAYQPGLRAVGR